MMSPSRHLIRIRHNSNTKMPLRSTCRTQPTHLLMIESHSMSHRMLITCGRTRKHLRIFRTVRVRVRESFRPSVSPRELNCRKWWAGSRCNTPFWVNLECRERRRDRVIHLKQRLMASCNKYALHLHSYLISIRKQSRSQKSKRELKRRTGRLSSKTWWCRACPNSLLWLKCQPLTTIGHLLEQIARPWIHNQVIDRQLHPLFSLKIKLKPHTRMNMSMKKKRTATWQRSNCTTQILWCTACASGSTSCCSSQAAASSAPTSPTTTLTNRRSCRKMIYKRW